MATLKVTFTNGETQIYTREDLTIEQLANEVFGSTAEGAFALGAKIEDADAPAKVAPIKSTKKKGE